MEQMYVRGVCHQYGDFLTETVHTILHKEEKSYSLRLSPPHNFQSIKYRKDHSIWGRVLNQSLILNVTIFKVVTQKLSVRVDE